MLIKSKVYINKESMAFFFIKLSHIICMVIHVSVSNAKSTPEIKSRTRLRRRVTSTLGQTTRLLEQQRCISGAYAFFVLWFVGRVGVDAAIHLHKMWKLQKIQKKFVRAVEVESSLEFRVNTHTMTGRQTKQRDVHNILYCIRVFLKEKKNRKKERRE